MDPIFGSLGLIGTIVFIITVISILRSSNSGFAKLGWIAIAFFLSIVGSILWFLIGRKK